MLAARATGGEVDGKPRLCDERSKTYTMMRQGLVSSARSFLSFGESALHRGVRADFCLSMRLFVGSFVCVFC